MFALLTGCGSQVPHKPPVAPQDRVIRAVYRDAEATMLVSYPADPARRMRADDCHAALLTDTASGATRPIPPEEARARMKTMQLAGATEGSCPGR